MLIPPCIVLITTSSLPILAASLNLPVQPVTCVNWGQGPTKPPLPSDCSILTTYLRSSEWALVPRRWGFAERGQFRTPKFIVHGTCEWGLNSYHSSKEASDVFKIADYFDTMLLVVSACLLGGRQPGGWFPVGPQNLFVIYMGSLDIDDLGGRLNGTRPVGNGTRQVLRKPPSSFPARAGGVPSE